MSRRGLLGVMAGTAVGAAYVCRRATAGRRWAPAVGRTVRTSTLTARVLGQHGPPVVLLHGLTGSGRYWGGAYDGLADARRLIVPDLLGFGHSPTPDTGYGPDDHVRALLTCLRELDVDQPAVIGAHSLGTLVGLRLAASYPGAVAALVAFGPPLYPDPATARRHVARAGGLARLFATGPLARAACRWVCEHRSVAAGLAVLTHPRLPPDVAAAGVQHTWASYSETLERVVVAAEATRWLSQLRAPVRLVAGRSDPVVDHAFLRSLVHHHQRLTVEVWDGGHDLPLVQADRCARFLDTVAAGAFAGEG